MPAKLPNELIRKPPPTVADLAPGSEGFVSLYNIEVDLDQSVYIRPIAQLEATGEKCARIRRDKQGAYHLHLDGINAQFKARDLDLYKRYGLVVPIESVSGIANG
jgi:hypothetical protein